MSDKENFFKFHIKKIKKFFHYSLDKNENFKNFLERLSLYKYIKVLYDGDEEIETTKLLKYKDLWKDMDLNKNKLLFFLQLKYQNTLIDFFKVNEDKFFYLFSIFSKYNQQHLQRFVKIKNKWKLVENYYCLVIVNKFNKFHFNFLFFILSKLKLLIVVFFVFLGITVGLYNFKRVNYNSDRRNIMEYMFGNINNFHKKQLLKTHFKNRYFSQKVERNILYHQFRPPVSLPSLEENIVYPQFSGWEYVTHLKFKGNLWYIYKNQSLPGEVLLYNISNPNFRNIVFVDKQNSYKRFINQVTNNPIFELKVYIYQFINIFLKIILKKEETNILGFSSIDLGEEKFLKIYVDNIDVRFVKFLIFVLIFIFKSDLISGIRRSVEIIYGIFCKLVDNLVIFIKKLIPMIIGFNFLIDINISTIYIFFVNRYQRFLIGVFLFFSFIGIVKSSFVYLIFCLGFFILLYCIYFIILYNILLKILNFEILGVLQSVVIPNKLDSIVKKEENIIKEFENSKRIQLEKEEQKLKLKDLDENIEN